MPERGDNLRMWVEGPPNTIVTTPALSTGVDVRIVRMMIHFDCPSHLNALWQELGRGGRDGRGCKQNIILSSKGINLRLTQAARSEAENPDTRNPGAPLDHVVEVVSLLSTPRCFFAEMERRMMLPVEEEHCGGHCNVCRHQDQGIDMSHVAVIILDIIDRIRSRAQPRASPFLTMDQLINLVLGEIVTCSPKENTPNTANGGHRFGWADVGEELAVEIDETSDLEASAEPNKDGSKQPSGFSRKNLFFKLELDNLYKLGLFRTWGMHTSLVVQLVIIHMCDLHMIRLSIKNDDETLADAKLNIERYYDLGQPGESFYL